MKKELNEEDSRGMLYEFVLDLVAKTSACEKTFGNIDDIDIDKKTDDLISLIQFINNNKATDLNIAIYDSKGKFELKGRGVVHVVDHVWLTDPRELVGKKVVIRIPEGNICASKIVKGVETYSIPYMKSNTKREIGLLV
jgi:hypothetical protein